MRAVAMNWCEACPKGKQKARDTDDVSESDDTKMSKAPQTKLVSVHIIENLTRI
jgi:hypothetical protein